MAVRAGFGRTEQAGERSDPGHVGRRVPPDIHMEMGSGDNDGYFESWFSHRYKCGQGHACQLRTRTQRDLPTVTLLAREKARSGTESPTSVSSEQRWCCPWCQQEAGHPPAASPARKPCASGTAAVHPHPHGASIPPARAGSPGRGRASPHVWLLRGTPCRIGVPPTVTSLPRRLRPLTVRWFNRSAEVSQSVPVPAGGLCDLMEHGGLCPAVHRASCRGRGRRNQRLQLSFQKRVLAAKPTSFSLSTAPHGGTERGRFNYTPRKLTEDSATAC